MKDVVSVCNSALDAQPCNRNKVKILLLRGRAYSHLGCYDAAKEDLTDAYSLDRDQSK